MGEVLNQNPDGSYKALFRTTRPARGIHASEPENAQRSLNRATYEDAAERPKAGSAEER